MIRKHELPILEYDDASPEVLRPTTTGSARNRERSSTALMVGRRHCSWCSAFRSGWNRKMDKTTSAARRECSLRAALVVQWGETADRIC